MRVFITGAAGFIGSAVTEDLIKAGHQVLGLSRSDKNTAWLQKAGAAVHKGDLTDLESLRRGAAEADAVIHLGFIHDFSKFVENCEIDRVAIEALATPLVGTKKPLIVTSGTAIVHASNGPVTEDMKAPTGPDAHPRRSEQAADAARAKGVTVATVRLPPTVHGADDHGFIHLLINIAREKKAAGYIGDGKNRWPAGHKLDVATLYRLVLESGVKHPIYHANAEEGVPFKSIAEAIAKGINVPAKSLDKDKAAEHFGWFGGFAGMDNLTSSQKTREWLGWKPRQPELLADIEPADYFKTK